MEFEMTRIDIEGTTALVTGANRGIGRAIAEALLERGAARVYLGARRPETLTDLTERYGARAVPLALDVTDRDQVRAAAEAAGDLELLINNAGVGEHVGGGFEDERWLDAGRREFEVNVLGTLDVTRAFAPVLARNGGGAVANVVSIAGLVNFPLFFSYSASKAALHNVTQGMRIFLTPQGTKVFGIYPGPVDTDMAEDVPFEKVAPSAVAGSVLAGIEAGIEEIFTDPMAEQFGVAYSQSPKELERQVAAMVLEGAAA
jgi:NAD(P)-dependent dehydrogenase (short-subunit alcohol dehydrogenase family)